MQVSEMIAHLMEFEKSREVIVVEKDGEEFEIEFITTSQELYYDEEQDLVIIGVKKNSSIK